MDDSKDRRLERIEVKLDDAADHIAAIDATLAGQHISLKEHIRRTNILETQMQPLKRHVNMVEGAFKLIGILASIAALIETIKMIMGK